MQENSYYHFIRTLIHIKIRSPPKGYRQTLCYIYLEYADDISAITSDKNKINLKTLMGTKQKLKNMKSNETDMNHGKNVSYYVVY